MSSPGTQRPSTGPSSVESREHHARLGAWFDQLCGLEGAELREGLERLEAEDAVLAAQVRGMLDLDGSKALLDQPVAKPEPMPRRIGKFKIPSRLGQGGTGVV